MIEHVCNPSTQQSKAGVSQVQDQSGLLSGIPSQKRKKGTVEATGWCKPK
jgi:hypothetical protein